MRRRRSYCTYCTRRLIIGGQVRIPPHSRAYTRDHVVPQALGGIETVRSCFACNNLKGHMLPAEWRAFMTANPRWWRLARGCVGG